jgi:GNAT superfamily N-acetyltransferase
LKEVALHRGYRPGSIGRIVQLHGEYYHENWGFGAFFEAKVARELGEFVDRYDALRDGFWTVSDAGRIEGAVIIDGPRSPDQGAHLRWFIVSDALRGSGIGNRLMEAAMDFCTDNKYPGVYLWTFHGLSAARHLYDKWGFKLVEEHRGMQWGTEVTEQRLVLRLTGTVL